MIQKLEHCVRGTDYGCGGASFSEVIDKVNEVIDYINSRPEDEPSKMSDKEIDRWVEEHLICPREGVARIDYNQLSDVLLRWGKGIAKKFYKLGLQDGSNKEGLQARQQEAD